MPAILNYTTCMNVVALIFCKVYTSVEMTLRELAEDMATLHMHRDTELSVHQQKYTDSRSRSLVPLTFHFRFLSKQLLSFHPIHSVSEMQIVLGRVIKYFSVIKTSTLLAVEKKEKYKR